jgi:sialic acid synthase SpsE
MWCEIGERRLGAGQPLFVVAELGLNHGGSVTRALALVDAAAAAGASAIKLQTIVADDLVADDGGALAHVSQPSLRAFFRTFELDEAAHRRVATRARACGLALLATPFSLAAVDMLERIGIDAYKIASGDLTFLPLIERCARTGKPLVIATGMAHLDEVRAAVNTARAAGARMLVLLHCVSAYPVPAGSENLRAISTLAHTFNTLVGLSDHASGVSAVPVAVALGASLYERHLMLPGDDGVDAAVSSTPEELALAIDMAARTHAALGHGRKECLPAESANVRASRRAMRAARPMRAGERVREEDVTYLRPATGLWPGRIRDLLGVRIGRDMAAGEAFNDCDLVEQDAPRDVA